jgi:hypothetical protein
MIKLYNADCLKVLTTFENESVDLIYCDLPYGTTQCKWDKVIPLNEMWKLINKIAKLNTPIIFHAQQPFTSYLIMSNIKTFKYTWVWEKSQASGFLNSKRRPLVAHEDIIVFCKGTPVYYPQMTEGTAYNKGLRKQQTENDVYGSFEQVEVKSDGLRYPRSVQYFKTAESEGKTFHKTQKPIKLAEYIIKTYTKKNDIVLDFTMGSGTACIACLNNNRQFVGIENDDKYYDIAVKRIQDAGGNVIQQRLSDIKTSDSRKRCKK